MLVETSAIVAILLREPEHDEFIDRIESASVVDTTIINAVEAVLGIG